MKTMADVTSNRPSIPGIDVPFVWQGWGCVHRNSPVDQSRVGRVSGRSSAAAAATWIQRLARHVKRIFRSAGTSTRGNADRTSIISWNSFGNRSNRGLRHVAVPNHVGRWRRLNEPMATSGRPPSPSPAPFGRTLNVRSHAVGEVKAGSGSRNGKRTTRGDERSPPSPSPSPYQFTAPTMNRNGPTADPPPVALALAVAVIRSAQPRTRPPPAIPPCETATSPAPWTGSATRATR